MVAEIVPDNPAGRTFRIVRKPADGLAYAAAIADRYGLSYERLRELLAR
jgi:DNA mismatch repair protein MutS